MKYNKIPVVTLGPSKVHLEHTILDPETCYICKEKGKDMTMLYIDSGKMASACVHHAGVIQTFIKQFGRLPIGWVEHGSTNSSEKSGGESNPV